MGLRNGSIVFRFFILTMLQEEKGEFGGRVVYGER
jgi:hypothetical protein